MLIPENGKWRWDDGPICDTQEEALASAKGDVSDERAEVYTVDTAEMMTIEEE